MSEIVVFGAGGRAGRRVIAEAVGRGHRVTAVVREPARHSGLAGDRVTLVRGDVTRADDVAEAAAGHDVAIGSVYRADVPSAEFYVAAAHALLEGLERAGVGRLLTVGVGTTLETAPGVPVHDTPGFPAEFRAFSLGHAAGLEVFRAAETPVDWLVVTPPPTLLDDEAPRTGGYRVGGNQVLPGDEGVLLSYADLAVALVDEIENPRHHRTQIAVAP
ncbi:NAD(P)-dependent oxidoreductase [Streptosporangium carneum]|nr:NAD(P)H-binding protein [Streptosporangium carneum]